MNTIWEDFEGKPRRKTRGEMGYEQGFADAKAQFEPKWIPVTERLPEEGARVFVTQTFGERTVVYCTIFPFEKTKEKYIIAWMPLPEPYKESEDKK